MYIYLYLSGSIIRISITPDTRRFQPPPYIAVFIPSRSRAHGNDGLMNPTCDHTPETNTKRVGSPPPKDTVHLRQLTRVIVVEKVKYCVFTLCNCWLWHRPSTFIYTRVYISKKESSRKSVFYVALRPIRIVTHTLVVGQQHTLVRRWRPPWYCPPRVMTRHRRLWRLLRIIRIQRRPPMVVVIIVVPTAVWHCQNDCNRHEVIDVVWSMAVVLVIVVLCQVLWQWHHQP